MSLLFWWWVVVSILTGVEVPHALPPVVPISAPATSPTAPPTAIQRPFSEGKATLYRPGLMEAVARRRGLKTNGTTGFATYPDCSTLGEVLVVSVLDPRSGKWSGWETKRIVDCSMPRDYARHVREGLVELSYEDALRYGYAREGRTRIRFYRR